MNGKDSAFTCDRLSQDRTVCSCTIQWQIERPRPLPIWYRNGVFWRAIIARLAGFAVTIPFIGSATLPCLAQPWQGPLAHLQGGMDISGIIGAIVSGLLYYGLARAYFLRQSISGERY